MPTLSVWIVVMGLATMVSGMGGGGLRQGGSRLAWAGDFGQGGQRVAQCFVGGVAVRMARRKGHGGWVCSADPAGEAASKEASAAAVERALAKRRRSRETPLSQRWFKQRQGVITPAQKRTLNELWPAYGCETRHNQMLELEDIFGRPGDLGDGSRRRRVLEVGFGTGDCMLELAGADPESDFFGIELHRASIATALKEADDRGLRNVRVCKHDAALVLRDHLPPAPLFAEVYILFPDPWPGKGNADRRILRSSTVDMLAERVAPGGLLRVATDVEAYAEHVRGVMGSAGGEWRLEAEVVEEATCEGRGAWGRPRTRYEQRAAKLGHSVWEFEYVRL